MLTPSELKTLGFLLAVGLTIGAFVALIAMGIACAMSGLTDLHDTEPDEGLNDLQQELDQWREERTAARLKTLHPALRETGYYSAFEHGTREAAVRRAMGGNDAA